MDLKNIRKDYNRDILDISGTPDDPFMLFGQWMEEALSSGIEDPNAMCLSTAGREGLPAARFVLLKDFDERGFVFYTNYDSRKGQQLAENPNTALTFYWKENERQVRVEGKTEKVSPEESDRYFQSRPFESRINAVISPQSQPIPGKEHLEKLHLQHLAAPEGERMERPANWGGYRVVPSYFEFWQGRPNRLHDRICYTASPTGWIRQRLAP